MSDNSEEINSSRQELFDHMSNEHGLTLLQSEMMEIERIVLASEIERVMPTEKAIKSESYFQTNTTKEGVAWAKGANWLKGLINKLKGNG